MYRSIIRLILRLMNGDDESVFGFGTRRVIHLVVLLFSHRVSFAIFAKKHACIKVSLTKTIKTNKSSNTHEYNSLPRHGVISLYFSWSGLSHRITNRQKMLFFFFTLENDVRILSQKCQGSRDLAMHMDSDGEKCCRVYLASGEFGKPIFCPNLCIPWWTTKNINHLKLRRCRTHRWSLV